MNPTKYIIALVALFALVLNANAQYTRYDGSTTIISGGTNKVLAATTNTYYDTATTNSSPTGIDVTKQSYVAFQVTGVANGATNWNVPIKFARSVDGLNYETTPGITITAVTSGTTPFTYVTTQQVDGYGWLKLVSVNNTNNSTYITNLVVKVSVKR